MSRQPELSHEKHIEWCAERAGDFVCDRDTAARKTEDGDVRATRVASEIRR
jgi:hypothetical protein